GNHGFAGSALLRTRNLPRWSRVTGTASPPTASRRTKSRSASSKASTTKSASSSAAPTAYVMRNISHSKPSRLACLNYENTPESATFFREEPVKYVYHPAEYLQAWWSLR